MISGAFASAATEHIVIVYGPALASYDFGPEHPLQPSRHQLTMALLEALGWLSDPRIELVEPRPATVTELLLVHNYAYIQAVQWAQEIATGKRAPLNLEVYGLGTEDNPLFAAIHDAPALYTGASIQAMEMLLQGQAIHAYNPAGGHHHAMKSRAAGFCVYNDVAAALAVALRHGERIAYVDLDAHHGDGVQAAFYEDPRVLTISVHESGHFLFPGTGDSIETGSGQGEGTSINIPLPPLAGDEALLAAVDQIILPAVRAFRPSLLVTQTGCDAHHADPLTDLNATLALFPLLAGRFHDLAHEVCAGRWLIVGGGGYDAADVTPRAWTAFLGTVLGRDVAEVTLPDSWRSLSQAYGGNPPLHLLDDTPLESAPISPGQIQQLLAEVEKTALAQFMQRLKQEQNPSA